MLSVSQHKMYKSAHATELWTSIWSTTATQSDALTNSSDQIPPAWAAGFASKSRRRAPWQQPWLSAAKAKCCARPGIISMCLVCQMESPCVSVMELSSTSSLNTTLRRAAAATASFFCGVAHAVLVGGYVERDRKLGDLVHQVCSELERNGSAFSEVDEGDQKDGRDTPGALFLAGEVDGLMAPMENPPHGDLWWCQLFDH